MKPDVVVDIGNSLIKWGRCKGAAVVDKASLPPDDPAAWAKQRAAWCIPAGAGWAVAGVHRARLQRLVEWLREQGDAFCILVHAAELPLVVQVEQPDRV